MNGNNCKTTCWLIAFAAGWLIGLYLWVGADWGFFWALIAGVIVCALAGVFLPRFFCSDEPANNNAAGSTRSSAAPTPAPKVEPTPTPKPTPPVEPETVSEPVSETVPDPEPETGKIEPAAEPSGSMITASTNLPGQNDLSDRKGNWRYQGDAPTSSASPAPAAAEIAPDAPAALASEGSQPKGLSGARSGGADNLKMIKGVGPKLEGVLNSLGFFHFDQIAEWAAADVAWVDENLKGFKGRVSRDNWVDQAKSLAAGEETEFAKRAKKDGIYD